MIYAFLIFVFALAMYALGNYMAYSMPCVEAGPISGVSYSGYKLVRSRVKMSYTKIVDGANVRYRRFVVKGDCMATKNIKPAEMIDVRMLVSDDDKKNIKEHDIVLIFLNDENFRGYKIREVKALVDGDEAETFYYSADGVVINSSKNHSLENIIGVVEGSSYPIPA